MGDSVALFGGATVTAKNPSTTVYLNTFWKSHPLRTSRCASPPPQRTTKVFTRSHSAKPNQTQPTVLCEYSGSICSSHGLCINRTCHCEFGWLDAACDVSYCLPDACMHGECKNRTIVPPSSTPTIIPPPGHGIVITTTTTTATTATAAGHRRLDVVHPPGSVCSCDPYWTGFNCTDALCAAGTSHATIHRHSTSLTLALTHTQPPSPTQAATMALVSTHPTRAPVTMGTTAVPAAGSAPLRWWGTGSMTMYATCTLVLVLDALPLCWPAPCT